MSFYECVFIARQDVSATQVDTLSEGFTKVIEDFGGKVTKKESWGLRSLAFRIKKNRKGHYVLFNIDAPAAAVEELDRQMRINEDILRHLTVRVEALQEEPSMILQNRGGRDERGGRRDDRFRGDRGRGGGEGGEEGGFGGGFRRGGEEGGGYRRSAGEGGNFRRGGDEGGGPRRSDDAGGGGSRSGEGEQA